MFRAEAALIETGCASESVALCPHACGNRQASQTSHRPDPVNADPADRAVAVETRSDQRAARHQRGFHRPSSAPVERNATGCDLGSVDRERSIST